MGISSRSRRSARPRQSAGFATCVERVANPASAAVRRRATPVREDIHPMHTNNITLAGNAANAELTVSGLTPAQIERLAELGPAQIRRLAGMQELYLEFAGVAS